MKIITKKEDIKIACLRCIFVYQEQSWKEFINEINIQILSKKVRFPLIEYFTKELFVKISCKDQIKTTDDVINLHTIGGNVIAGIVLQTRLEKHFKQSINKAVEYIIEGNEWYVCDIIGERVFGFALLTAGKD